MSSEEIGAASVAAHTLTAHVTGIDRVTGAVPVEQSATVDTLVIEGDDGATLRVTARDGAVCIEHAARDGAEPVICGECMRRHTDEVCPNCGSETRWSES